MTARRSRPGNGSRKYKVTRSKAYLTSNIYIHDQFNSFSYHRVCVIVVCTVEGFQIVSFKLKNSIRAPNCKLKLLFAYFPEVLFVKACFFFCLVFFNNYNKAIWDTRLGMIQLDPKFLVYHSRRRDNYIVRPNERPPSRDTPDDVTSPILALLPRSSIESWNWRALMGQ